ncbi:hypothetical protein EB001_01170 [bacterium]|nr:hypothetical protein [bacterium]
MTTAFILATVKTLSAANVQLGLGALLALSEVLGADPRIKSNGIISFVLLQVQNFLRRKKEEV